MIPSSEEPQDKFLDIFTTPRKSVDDIVKQMVDMHEGLLDLEQTCQQLPPPRRSIKFHGGYVRLASIDKSE